jgi:hypothetical protein
MSDPAAAAATATSNEASQPFDPIHPDMRIIRRCRSLTVHGAQCRAAAIGGQDFCVRHFSRSPVEFPTRGRIVVPLLEDHGSIQLLCTQIAHGVLNKAVDLESARVALSACKVASLTISRPARIASDAKPEPVVEQFYMDEENNRIGPREPYRGPSGLFEPEWSFSKYLYEQECERLGRPKPTCAAEYPASGWLTEEETKQDAREWAGAYSARIAALEKQKEEMDRAGATSEPLRLPAATAEKACWCGGPEADFPCHICRETNSASATPEARSEGVESKGPEEAGDVDLNAVADLPLAVRLSVGPSRAKSFFARRTFAKLVHRRSAAPNVAKSDHGRKNTSCCRTRRPGLRRLPLLSFEQVKFRYFGESREAFGQTPSILGLDSAGDTP